MRYLIYISLFILCGCNPVVKVIKNESEKKDKFKYSEDTLYFHFQGGFKNDTISIFENTNKILEKCINTDEIWGFAYEYTYPRNKYNNNLSVVLKKKNYQYQVKLDDINENFIGIWYSSKGGIKYYTKKTPFIYE